MVFKRWPFPFFAVFNICVETQAKRRILSKRIYFFDCSKGKSNAEDRAAFKHMSVSSLIQHKLRFITLVQFLEINVRTIQSISTEHDHLV